MNLNCETILVYYTHENKKILCQIQVNWQQKRNWTKTCRSLTQDQWKKFDKKLAKLISKTDNWNDEESNRSHGFKIKPLIEVQVQKSKLSLKCFKKCFGTIVKERDEENTDDLEEADYILQCLFDFQDEPDISSIVKDDSTTSEEIPNTPVSIKASTRRFSRENSKSSHDEVSVKTFDERESPERDKTTKVKSKEEKTKPIEEHRRRKRSKTVDDVSKLREVKNAKDEYRSSPTDCHNEHKKLKKYSQSTEDLPKLKKIVTEANIIKPLETIKENKEHDKKPHKCSSSTSTEYLDDASQLNTKSKLKESNNGASNLNVSISSETTESATDTSPSNVRKGRKPKENISTPVRRSARSPNKPQRYTDAEIFTKKKSRKHKSSPTNTDRIRTNNDDDEDDDFEKTPVSKKINKSASSSSSSSTKNKRKRVRGSECEQEKRNISKWLFPKSTSTDKQTTKSTLQSSKGNEKKSNVNRADSRSNSTTDEINLLSTEERELENKKNELIKKNNAKIKAELEKYITGPPKKVEFLSLQNMTAEEMVKTFSNYKSDLDEIYEKNRRRDYIKGHGGINHCFIIQLLQKNVQMKMLDKLTEVYSNQKASTQATLFANALLPEWVIRVYMEQFKFTRQEAIDQIKAQEEFRLHEEEQSDNSFMFD